MTVSYSNTLLKGIEFSHLTTENDLKQKEGIMAKIRRALKLMTESFSEFVLKNHEEAVEAHELQHECTIEQAKLKSYEVRRHLI